MLERTWKKILRRKPLSLWAIPAVGLWVASGVYRLGFKWHQSRQKEPVRLKTPVLSVGGITVGGSGKTPLAHVIAHALQQEGLTVGIVSSGYGRESSEPYLDPGYKLTAHDADAIGDEVRLLAAQLPEVIFSIHDNKTEAAKRLDATGEVDVIIVDDGFQHFELARDIDLVTYDAAHKKRMLRLFPHGVLREPVSALKRADIVVITRARFAKDIGKLRKRIEKRARRADVYAAGFIPEALYNDETRKELKYLEDKSVFLFAGVGNFRPLRKQVMALCADLDYALELDDHQRYDQDTLEHIRDMADDHDSDVILTTGKDWMKFGDFDFECETYYLGLSIDLDPGEERLVKNIMDKLKLERQTT